MVASHWFPCVPGPTRINGRKILLLASMMMSCFNVFSFIGITLVLIVLVDLELRLSRYTGTHRVTAEEIELLGFFPFDHDAIAGEKFLLLRSRNIVDAYRGMRSWPKDRSAPSDSD